MRSTRPDLERVLAEFDAWRAKPRGRLIPDRLWKAAVGLLDGYSSSLICRQLRLNPTRFKQAREARGVVARPSRPAGRRRRRTVAAGWVPRTGRRAGAPDRVMTLTRGRAFAELPPLAVAGTGGIMPATVSDAPRRAAACRLIVETAAGTLTVVTAMPHQGLVDAVCRVVLGALADGS
jgi:hypothetical protein